MTGTLDLSIEQVRALAENAERDKYDREVVRFIIHPEADKAVRVVTRAITSGDVTTGTSIVLRSGEILTVKEYEQYLQRTTTSA